MMAHKHPMDDVERLENVMEGLRSALEDEGPSVDQVRAEACGIDFAAWGAEIRAKTEARVRAERRALRAKAQRTGWAMAGVALVAAAAPAAVVLAMCARAAPEVPIARDPPAVPDDTTAPPTLPAPLPPEPAPRPRRGSGTP